MREPAIVWQITTACDLDCPVCPKRDAAPSEELSTYEAYKTIDQISSLKPRRFVLSGGDPLARHDIYQIIEYSTRRGLEPIVELSPTKNLVREAIEMLHVAGAKTILVTLNGPTAFRHDLTTGVRGSFSATVNAIRWAQAIGMTVEVNTLATRRNLADFRQIAGLLGEVGATAWNVHFVVPIGTSRHLEILTADEVEHAFATLADIQTNSAFRIRTVEAPAYRRFRMQHISDGDPQTTGLVKDMPADVADCILDETVFIAPNGAVRPSQFLPVAAGNLRYRPLFAIVKASDLFVAFRDTDNLTGKCRHCEYRAACGGSRARSWAATGMLFGPDPICAYQPPGGGPA